MGEQEVITDFGTCNNIIASKSKLYNDILEFEDKVLFVWHYLKPDEIQCYELNGFLFSYFKGCEW